jgi:hypothetical protein
MFFIYKLTHVKAKHVTFFFENNRLYIFQQNPVQEIATPRPARVPREENRADRDAFSIFVCVPKRASNAMPETPAGNRL